MTAREQQAATGRAIEIAAKYLPPGWEIDICVERDAGWVDVINADGLEYVAANDAVYMHDRIIFAVRKARELAKQQTQPTG